MVFFDMPFCSQTCGSGKEVYQKTATSALAILACKDENHDLIVDEGGIPILLDLIDSGNDGCKEQAAWALANLCVLNPRAQTILLENNAQDRFISLLGAEDGKSKAKAALAISNLVCAHPLCQKAVVSVGAVPLLIQMLSIDHELCNRNACLSLANLADGSIREIVIKAGAIPPITRLLDSSDEPCRETAAIAIRKLLVGNPDRVAISDFTNADGIRLVVKEWKYNLPDTTDHCEAIMTALGEVDSALRNRIEAEKDKPMDLDYDD